MTTFLRILDAPVDEKPTALLRAVAALRDPSNSSKAAKQTVFEREPKAFAEVPGSPFAYWVSEKVRSVFTHFPAFEVEGRTVKQGPATADDFRFVRLLWELADTRVGERWFGFAKGGAFSPFYADVFLATNWEQNGHEMKAWTVVSYGGGHWSRNLRNPDFYFRPGLTWPLRTQSGFGMRAMPAGCIFGHKGPAAFVEGDDPEQLLALLALTTTSAFCFLVELQMAFGSYEVGVIQRTPIPDLTPSDVTTLASLARRAWSLERTLDTTNEVSHAFVLPPGTRGYEALAPDEHAGGFRRAAIEQELVALQGEIDQRAFSLYGIVPEDRAAIEQASKRGTTSSSPEDPDDSWDGDEGDAANDAPLDAPTLRAFSWLVGVAFGRFDPRLATGKRAIPREPEPFEPLPARSPGMWPAAEERSEPSPDIMVDDPGHDDDLCLRVAGAAAQAGWHEPEGLRPWLAKEFFPLHLKMYSKSRRKAPIYWQLATPSASYSAWLYVHAFTKDILFRVQGDYVAPKLAHEQRRLESMTSELRHSQTAAERKALATQETLVDELRAFLDEVKRVAPLWNPNLDDGVIINFAVLWRLVPQHKPWQNELQATWGALCDGKYDWAHLAMHLWPERVVPKCAEDRSLAIAHELEDVFWSEGSDGKWTRRTTPTRPIEALVRERTSAAVKAALENLLEAPAPAAGGGKKKSSRKKTDSRFRPASSSRSRSNGARGEATATPDAELLSKVTVAIAAVEDGASKAAVIEATGITAGQWTTAIKTLLADGSVRQAGERRAQRYWLTRGDE